MSHDSSKNRASFGRPGPDGQHLPTLTRRNLIHTIGLAIASSPFVNFLGCATRTSTSPAADASSGSSSSSGGSTNPDGSTTPVNVDGPWATGGTATMTGDYPDPFADGLGTACDLTCAATLGPCYAETVTRRDISEGHDGLPTRLALLVVDESCNPIENASVDIWHCGPEGLYSGSDASDFCTSGDATARAARWFRGEQKTDANGRVDFDTCFPGWYSSRTIHIHFTIRVGDTEFVTSQFVFDDTLCDGIVANEPLYSTRGPRDTTNANDNVVSAESAPDYMFQTARMEDGAMLAWKAIVLRSSTSTALCQVSGGSGGGGPGGGPGGPPP